MSELKAGDRVRVYAGDDAKYTGEVKALHGDDVEVHLDGTEDNTHHVYRRAICRKLVSKRKLDQSAA